MRPIFPTLLLLAACGGPDTLGAWEGDCAVSSMGYDAVYGFALDIEADEGREITGTAALDDGYFVYDALLVGERKGRDLDLDLELQLPGTTGDDFGLTFGIEATVKGDTMEGECKVGAMGFGISGDIVLERVP